MANSVRGRLKPGEDYWVRYYLIVNTMENVLEKAKEYKEKADYGVLKFSEDTATLQPLYRKKLPDGIITLTRKGAKGAKPVCRVYSEPVLNSKPLFLIRELPTGLSAVTTDPYELCHKEEWKNPVPKGHKYHDALQDVKKCRPYWSQEKKDLKWKLLGYVMPSDKAQEVPEGYVKLATIVDGPGTRGMLALGCTTFD